MKKKNNNVTQGIYIASMQLINPLLNEQLVKKWQGWCSAGVHLVVIIQKQEHPSY